MGVSLGRAPEEKHMHCRPDNLKLAGLTNWDKEEGEGSRGKGRFLFQFITPGRKPPHATRMM